MSYHQTGCTTRPLSLTLNFFPSCNLLSYNLKQKHLLSIQYGFVATTAIVGIQHTKHAGIIKSLAVLKPC